MREKERLKKCVCVCVGRVEWGAQLGLRHCEGVENSRVCVCVCVDSVSERQNCSSSE